MPRAHSTLLLNNVSAESPGHLGFRDLSLKVSPGSFHGVFGQAQAGKTTLAEAVMGLSPVRGGNLLVDGLTVSRRGRGRRVSIGYQPQNPTFLPHLTLVEHLRTVGGMYGVSERKIRVLIEALWLDDSADTKVECLSARDQKLLAIATAVVNSPSLLVLDEPTFGLGADDRQTVISLLRSSNINGMTTLYLTRNIDELERLCDDVTLIQAAEARSQFASVGAPESEVPGEHGYRLRRRHDNRW